ncbi:MAG: PDDEXK nuclease domain-containing protein [Propioniciclava sp.]|uniref:PDDEXK nuclease domain-containing protein n=1 Tax=Propioniciclava sp. TaxID=2038686 RepID=UPI0039E338CE
MSDEVDVPGLMRADLPHVVEAPDDEAEAAYLAIRATIVTARRRVSTAIRSEMVEAYWEVGRRIVETQGERAEYGKRLLHYLAQRLTSEFGRGYRESNLRNMRQFYLAYPIRYALRSELSWTHYRELMRITDLELREFYAREAAESGWTARQLRRQVTSSYHLRLLATRSENRPEVAAEVMELEPRTKADDLLKDPYVFEFLEVAAPAKLLERDLEQGLIDKLQDFLLELGKGFSFVARQKRVTGSDTHYYVDLVFYNYILKCFVLVDLKVGKLTHQDIGQMDFYRRIFDDKVRPEGDNPSIGIILCSSKDEAIVKYSILADGVGLYAAGYKTYLPSEEELQEELRRERELLESESTEADEA